MPPAGWTDSQHFTFCLSSLQFFTPVCWESWVLFPEQMGSSWFPPPCNLSQAVSVCLCVTSLDPHFHFKRLWHECPRTIRAPMDGPQADSLCLHHVLEPDLPFHFHSSKGFLLYNFQKASESPSFSRWTKSDRWCSVSSSSSVLFAGLGQCLVMQRCRLPLSWDVLQGKWGLPGGFVDLFIVDMGFLLVWPTEMLERKGR